MTETVTIKGLDQLGKAFRDLPKILANKTIRKATAVPALRLRDKARELAPVWRGNVSPGHPQPGALRKAIQIKRITGLPATRCIYIVFCRHGKKFNDVGKNHRNLDAYYWWWVEFGTAKSAARPFMRPAFESRKDECLAVQVDTFRQGVLDAAWLVRWGRPT